MYPEHVGYPVGINDTGSVILVEIHYDNPGNIKGTKIMLNISEIIPLSPISTRVRKILPCWRSLLVYSLSRSPFDGKGDSAPVTQVAAIQDFGREILYACSIKFLLSYIWARWTKAQVIFYQATDQKRACYTKGRLKYLTMRLIQMSRVTLLTHVHNMHNSYHDDLKAINKYYGYLL